MNNQGYNQNQGLNGLGQNIQGFNTNQNYNVQTQIKRPKRKKKHRFIKFIMLCLVIYTSYRLFGIALSKIAEQEMQKFVIDYPFEFVNESDSLWYVTDDIIVTNTYKFGDKQYEVNWSTNNKAINISESTEGTSRIEIKRPNNSAIKVDLVETYKKLWGKATREYQITIIPTSTISDINIITKEDISSGNYNRDMQAIYDESDNLKYMLGDFKNTYVNSIEDATTILDLYKEQFTDNDITFKFDSSSNIGVYTTYKFIVYLQDINISNSYAAVTVNNEDNKLNKISIDLPDKLNIEEIDEPKSTEELNNIVETYIKDELNTEDYISSSQITYIDNILTAEYIIVTQSESYKIKLNANTGEVISCESLLSDSEIHAIPNMSEVQANGKTEDGTDITFEATKLTKVKGLIFQKYDESYILYDRARNIRALDNEGWWYLYKKAEEKRQTDDAGLLLMIGGLIDYYIEVNSGQDIISETPTFEDSHSIQAYRNLQIAYDWYKDNLGLISYDNKGSELILRTHVNIRNDNASWEGASKTMTVNPPKYYKYSLGLYPVVMGHEYTHGVFFNAGIGLDGGSNEEVAGLNEAYADIMGIVINEIEDWRLATALTADGKTEVPRDLKDINTELTRREFAEKYRDEYWTGEEHNICTVIGHVAYEMKANGGFSWSDIGKIWYNSLGLGYDNSSTYVTCRKYIIKTAEDLGYSDEQVDFIARAFDDREIFDPSYEFKTIETPEQTNDTASDGSTTDKTKSSAVSGDPILDDTSPHRFMIAYSIIGSVLGKSDIIIYEEADTLTKEEQEAMSDRISQLLAKQGLTDINDKPLSVIYKQVGKTHIDILEKFCNNSMSNIKSVAYNSIGINTTDDEFTEAKGWLEYVFSLCLDWSVTNKTAYEFYDQLGAIE